MLLQLVSPKSKPGLTVDIDHAHRFAGFTPDACGKGLGPGDGGKILFCSSGMPQGNFITEFDLIQDTIRVAGEGSKR